MTEPQIWLRVIGTAFQVVGLLVAFFALLATHRRYSVDRRGFFRSAAAKARDAAQGRLRTVWRKIRRQEPEQPSQFGPSLIGFATSTIGEGPENPRRGKNAASVDEQLHSLAEYAAEDLESVRALDAEQARLREDLDATKQGMRAIEQSIVEISEAQVREYALDGLPWAAAGLILTAIGTLIAAFS